MWIWEHILSPPQTLFRLHVDSLMALYTYVDLVLAPWYMWTENFSLFLSSVVLVCSDPCSVCALSLFLYTLNNFLSKSLKLLIIKVFFNNGFQAVKGG